MPTQKSKLERLTGSGARDFVRWFGVAVGLYLAFHFRSAVAGCETQLPWGLTTNPEQLLSALFAAVVGFGAASIMRVVELKFGKK